jgi:hypothetical protein
VILASSFKFAFVSNLSHVNKAKSFVPSTSMFES